MFWNTVVSEVFLRSICELAANVLSK